MKVLIFITILFFTTLNLFSETMKIKCVPVSKEKAAELSPDLMNQMQGKLFIPMKMGGIVELQEFDEYISTVHGRMLIVSEAGNNEEMVVEGYYTDKADVMQIAPVGFLHSAIISLNPNILSTFHFIDHETVGITSCRRW